ncbi:MAG TPA: HAD-IIB family hydrolase [Polyangiaceae bacterium]|nr:HAD-IIB family hydrolase [Polyangiaceae bacterium]
MRRHREEPVWCLITDIDGTLIGETDSTARLKSTLRAERARLQAQGGRLYWVIATGRTRQSCIEVLTEQGFALDDFDALVTSVGAELEIREHLPAQAEYRARLAASGFDAERVRACLEPLPFLRLQPEDEQHVHKVSYWAQNNPAQRALVQNALATLPFCTQIGFSHDEYLDIAPDNGAKGGAVRHLLEHWTIPARRAVAAGDSGNDRSMLCCEWYGIVVGNGHGELDDLRGREMTFFATQRHAAGILQGLEALGFM